MSVHDNITNQQTEGFIDGNTTGDDYTYDTNGNMTQDKNKGITGIEYSHLNLPTTVNFGTSNKIEYIYDATGVKQKKIVSTGTTTEYAGNYIYEKTTVGEQLKFFNQPEGYVEPDGSGGFDYVYQYKDHLGNVRLTYSDADLNGSIDPNTEILSENNYYPGGLLHKGYNNVVSANANSSAEKYKYNGKELQDDLGLGLYDYGARMYDPAIWRWNGVDPLAEKYVSISPYVYVANNPINAIDPDGRDIWEINKQGKVINRIEDESQDAFYMVAKDADGNYQRTYTTDEEGNKTYNSISFEYGTVEDFQSQYSDEKKTTLDWYNVRGDNNGKQLFEFFSKNTKVEFSQLLLGRKGDDGLNIISTSHDESTDRSVNFLLDSQYKFGYTIRGHNHNHPRNTPYPSGLDSRGSDIGFANRLTNISIKNGSGIPAFKIYVPETGRYVNYNRNSTIFDFPATNPTIMLDEVIITN